MSDQLNAFVYAASAQFVDRRYLANAFHVTMSEFGAFHVLFLFQVEDLSALRFTALEVYTDHAPAARFLESILCSACVYTLPAGAIEVAWQAPAPLAVHARVTSRCGPLRELSVGLKASEQRYEYAEALIPLETFFGRAGDVQDCKEWYAPATAHGYLRLADGIESTLPSAGQIKRAEYLYFGPRRAGVHRETTGEAVVVGVSQTE